MEEIFLDKLKGLLALIVRGEQNVTQADPTDWRRQHRLDTSTDQMSRGRRSIGKARFDAGAV